VGRVHLAPIVETKEGRKAQPTVVRKLPPEPNRADQRPPKLRPLVTQDSPRAGRVGLPTPLWLPSPQGRSGLKAGIIQSLFVDNPKSTPSALHRPTPPLGAREWRVAPIKQTLTSAASTPLQPDVPVPQELPPESCVDKLEGHKCTTSTNLACDGPALPMPPASKAPQRPASKAPSVPQRLPFVVPKFAMMHYTDILQPLRASQVPKPLCKPKTVLKSQALSSRGHRPLSPFMPLPAISKRQQPPGRYTVWAPRPPAPVPSFKKARTWGHLMCVPLPQFGSQQVVELWDPDAISPTAITFRKEPQEPAFPALPEAGDTTLDPPGALTREGTSATMGSFSSDTGSSLPP